MVAMIGLKPTLSPNGIRVAVSAFIAKWSDEKVTLLLLPRYQRGTLTIELPSDVVTVLVRVTVFKWLHRQGTIL